MRAEYETANAASQNRAKFIQIEADGFKYLEYFIVSDGNNTAICKQLDGKVFAIDDPKLDTFCPPNHFKCRSTFRATNKKPNDKKVTAEPAKGFNKHFGKTGQVFDKANPYLTVAPVHKGAAQDLFGLGDALPISLDQLIQNIDIIAKLDKNDFDRIEKYTESGGAMMVRKNAHQKDLDDNIQIAESLAKSTGKVIQINEHIENNGKNPELTIDRTLSDLKSPIDVKVSNIKGAFNLARKQLLTHLVIDLPKKPVLDDVLKGCIKGFQYNEGINEAILVFKGKTLSVTRKDYEDMKLEEKLKRWL